MAGDGSDFVLLFERYEQRVYNLAYRLTGSEADAADATEEAFLRVMRQADEMEDGVPAAGPGLFTATRGVCRELLASRRPAGPAGAAPDSTREELPAANMRLPERQREALALREVAELSYDEIAANMEVSRSSVAQLICRGRINLSDELHGTTMAAVAAPSPECERALPLIAAREDEQLEASEDDGWLDAHLADCERCELAAEAMQKGGDSYRAWAPIAPLPWLLEETMTKAATLAGGDWSEEIATAMTSRADTGPMPGVTAGPALGDRAGGWSSRRRRATAAAGIAALLLGGGIATALVGGEGSRIGEQPIAEPQSAAGAAAPQRKSKARRSKRDAGRARQAEPTPRTTTAASPTPAEPSPVEAVDSAPSEPPAPAPDRRGTAGLQPTQPTGASQPKPRPKPASQPAPAPAPPAETQPATAPPPPTESSPEHPAKGRGPPAGVPAHGGSK